MLDSPSDLESEERGRGGHGYTWSDISRYKETTMLLTTSQGWGGNFIVRVLMNAGYLTGVLIAITMSSKQGGFDILSYHLA